MQNAIKEMSKGVVYFAKRKRKRKTIASPKEIHQEQKIRKGKRKEHTSTRIWIRLFSFFHVSSGCDSTLTPLDELTLRMSLPSSANSLLRTTFPAASASRSAVVSGLSPSATAGPAKSGFRNILRKASAIMAASAPDKGPPLSLVVDAASAGRFLVTIDGETPVAVVGIPVWGGSGGLSTIWTMSWLSRAIIGEAEPIEFRFESISLLLRMRRKMKKTTMHEAAMARKPKMTMTAIAQRGKDEDEGLDWMVPECAADAELSTLDREAARADEEEAAAAALEEDATESRTVVWTAVKTDWLIWLPSRVWSLRIMTQ
jgi:hypothetical protein